MRVHEIAKLTHRTNREVIDAAGSLNIRVTSGSSALSPQESDLVIAAALRQPRHTAEPSPAPPLRPSTPSATRMRSLPGNRRVRTATLSPMARVMMSAFHRSAPTVSAEQADRLEDEALQWAHEGFDDKSVRPWHDSCLPPPVCGYLARRGVSPDVLTLTLPSSMGFDHEIDIATLLAIKEWTVEQVYELLVATGVHTPPPEPVLIPEQPASVRQPARTAPPVLFSSAGADNVPASTPASRPRHTTGRRSPRTKR
jgi:hypothetical protein